MRDNPGQAGTITPRVSVETPPALAWPPVAVFRIGMPTHVPIVNAAGEIVTEPLYDPGEIAGLLGTSVRTVKRRVNAGVWPHVRRDNGQLFFTAEHVRLIVSAFAQSHDYPAHEPADPRTIA